MDSDYERADGLFLGFGVDYYVAGRAMALAQRMPLVGNQFHHAIEMMLKARLVRTRSLDELAHEFGHRLPRLWDAFKAEFGSIDLSEFDGTILTLDKFERLRYPNQILKEGMGMQLEWEKPAAWSSTGRSEPQYVLAVNDIDLLVAKIFDVSDRNPPFFTNRLNEYARDALVCYNPAADFLLGR